MIYKKDTLEGNSFRELKLMPHGHLIENLKKWENIDFKNFDGNMTNCRGYKPENIYYLFCGEIGVGIRVARSVSGVEGPYDVHAQVLVPGQYTSPSIVKDISDERDVLVFGYEGSSKGVRLVCLNWKNDWPYAVKCNSEDCMKGSVVVQVKD